MIIAFYPGGGGNRFYKWMLGERNFLPNKVYDQLNTYQTYANRYPGKETRLIDHEVIFTHCVNYDLITKSWPKHEKIYFIDTDFFKSLRRQWVLSHKFVCDNKHPAGGPFSTITWHDDYYAKYPWDPGQGIVVNDKNFIGFSNMMQQELSSIKCDEFDFAQQMFEQHGTTAPILDLYNTYYEQR